MKLQGFHSLEAIIYNRNDHNFLNSAAKWEQSKKWKRVKMVDNHVYSALLGPIIKGPMLKICSHRMFQHVPIYSYHNSYSLQRV